MDELNNLSCYFEVEQSVVICIWVIFFFDKVTTVTYNFVSIKLNAAHDGATVDGLAAAFTVI